MPARHASANQSVLDSTRQYLQSMPPAKNLAVEKNQKYGDT